MIGGRYLQICSAGRSDQLKSLTAPFITHIERDIPLNLLKQDAFLRQNGAQGYGLVCLHKAPYAQSVAYELIPDCVDTKFT